MIATFLNRLVVPRLRRMSGSQLDRYIKRACRRHWPLHLTLQIATIPVALGSILWGLSCGIAVADYYLAESGGSGTPMVLVNAAIVLGIALPMLIWAVVVTLAVRWSVARFLARCECPCGYSLSGLNATDGMIVCPECADRIVLADRGLTPEMLQTDDARTSAAG